MLSGAYLQAFLSFAQRERFSKTGVTSLSHHRSDDRKQDGEQGPTHIGGRHRLVGQVHLVLSARRCIRIDVPVSETVSGDAGHRAPEAMAPFLDWFVRRFELYAMESDAPPRGVREPELLF